MPVLLCLDFDGVLHPVASRTEPKFCRLELLETWLRQRPEVSVLLTTSWRQFIMLGELMGCFSKDVQPRIMDTAPLFKDIYGYEWQFTNVVAQKSHHRRQAEVEHWIAMSRWAGGWVALEGDRDRFEHEHPRVVVCDPMVGLTPERLEALDSAIAWLQGGAGAPAG